ncbi:MAG: hypothetical protein MJY78_10280, partial [Fibrobacter sp.]|nr:hypothetical protein [Fibrobacter sp.]
ALTDVTGDAVYSAVYDSTSQIYTVVFMNESEELMRAIVGYGEIPSYNGKIPEKMPTDSSVFKFVGWNSEIQLVVGNTIYTAKFEEIKKKFIVRFMNENELLKSQVVDYGDVPNYAGEIPVKNSNSSYTYNFVGWLPEIGAITEKTDFVAVFDSTKITRIDDSRYTNLKISVVGKTRSVQISAATQGSAYVVLDMQGRALNRGIVASSNFNVPVRRPGRYLVRVGSYMQQISVK